MHGLTVPLPHVVSLSSDRVSHCTCRTMSALFAEFADVEHKRTAAMQRILQRYAALLQRNQGGFDVHVKEVCVDCLRLCSRASEQGTP